MFFCVFVLGFWKAKLSLWSLLVVVLYIVERRDQICQQNNRDVLNFLRVTFDCTLLSWFARRV